MPYSFALFATTESLGEKVVDVATISWGGHRRVGRQCRMALRFPPSDTEAAPIPGKAGRNPQGGEGGFRGQSRARNSYSAKASSSTGRRGVFFSAMGWLWERFSEEDEYEDEDEDALQGGPQARLPTGWDGGCYGRESC